MDWYVLAQSIIGLLVITAPPDPVKLVFFNSVVAEKGLSRSTAAFRVAAVVFVVLGVSAVAGKQIFQLIGIDLNAFSVVGGIIVAGMGFEMLHGGTQSKTQGQKEAVDGPDEDSGLLMPLAIPLIAGPGAIATVVTMASANEGEGVVEALIGVGAVAIIAFVSFAFLGGLLAKVSTRTTALLLRMGGMLLATIGAQMVLGGVKRFFE